MLETILTNIQPLLFTSQPAFFAQPVSEVLKGTQEWSLLNAFFLNYREIRY